MIAGEIMIIGVTGMTGVGKTFFSMKLSKYLERHKYTTININVDVISRNIILTNPDIIEQTAYYLTSELCYSINDQNFWDALMYSRLMNSQINDPLIVKIEEKITNIIENLSKNVVIIIDWAILPKSRLFNVLDKKILLTANDDDRKASVFKRDNNYNFVRRDKYAILYDKYQYDLEICNDYSEDSFDFVISNMMLSFNNVECQKKLEKQNLYQNY